MPRPKLVLSVLLALFAILTLSVLASADEPERKYLLERVDDVAVVQLYCDGFDQLPLEQKKLLYHLYEAAVAGRDIFLHQKYAHSPLLRDMLEEIITHAEGIDPDTLAEIRRYTKLFWINNGPHNSITSKKNVIRCSKEDFRKAARKALAGGAKLPRLKGKSFRETLDTVWPILADPTLDPTCTNSAPGPGKDILQESCNSYYRGVTVEDLEDFEERYPLNSTVEKRNGKIRERIWRGGFDDVVPPGLYADEINTVVEHIENAIPHATPPMARALALLTHYYRTGNPLDFRAYNIAWVQDTDSPVDTINGFIEVYLDARGQKGAFEGIVYFNDPVKMDLISKIADNAQWFENHMAFDPKFRKDEVKGISAKAIQIVVATGDAGPVSMIGINLPNAADIREHYGSKSVSLSNVLEARDKSASKEAKSEFCWTDEEFQRSLKWSTLVLDLEVNMHEVIGHGSGKNAASLKVDPATVIGEYYSALEEARADLVALWFIGNKKLADLGLAEETDLPEIEKAAYESYTRNALAQLRRITEGNQIEEAHMRNRQMIVHWLMEHSDAVEVKNRDGKTYYVMADVDAWREGVGRLLAEVQRIKSEGDRPAAEKLFLNYGTNFDPALRDEVIRRYKKLDLPSYAGLVMPELTPQHNADGQITDVTVSYPCDLEAQMLKWSGRKIGVGESGSTGLPYPYRIPQRGFTHPWSVEPALRKPCPQGAFP